MLYRCVENIVVFVVGIFIIVLSTLKDKQKWS